jgi:hypothetical protein
MVTAWKISRYLFLALSVALFHSPQAASEAFSPRLSSWRHNSRIVGGQELFHPQKQQLLKPTVAMTTAEGLNEDNNNEVSLPLRGGGQSKMGKKLLREMIAE